MNVRHWCSCLFSSLKEEVLVRSEGGVTREVEQQNCVCFRSKCAPIWFRSTIPLAP
jgi:hypothetical protein